MKFIFELLPVLPTSFALKYDYLTYKYCLSCTNTMCREQDGGIEYNI